MTLCAIRIWKWPGQQRGLSTPKKQGYRYRGMDLEELDT
jgi:hypothetical protein